MRRSSPLPARRAFGWRAPSGAGVEVRAPAVVVTPPGRLLSSFAKACGESGESGRRVWARHLRVAIIKNCVLEASRSAKRASELASEQPTGQPASQPAGRSQRLQVGGVRQSNASAACLLSEQLGRSLVASASASACVRALTSGPQARAHTTRALPQSQPALAAKRSKPADQIATSSRRRVNKGAHAPPKLASSHCADAAPRARGHPVQAARAPNSFSFAGGRKKSANLQMEEQNEAQAE